MTAQYNTAQHCPATPPRCTTEPDHCWEATSSENSVLRLALGNLGHDSGMVQVVLCFGTHGLCVGAISCAFSGRGGLAGACRSRPCLRLATHPSAALSGQCRSIFVDCFGFQFVDMIVVDNCAYAGEVCGECVCSIAGGGAASAGAPSCEATVTEGTKTVLCHDHHALQTATPVTFCMSLNSTTFIFPRLTGCYVSRRAPLTRPNGGQTFSRPSMHAYR